MARKKPSWLQKAQTATSNVVKPVVQAVTPPPAPKVMQNIQKAASTVAKPVQQAAQAVQKAAVAPVKAVTQAVTQAPAKALQAVQKVAQNIPNPTAPLKSENTNFEFMPYVFKKLPDAIGDVVKGTGRAVFNAPKAMTGDTKDFVSGAEMVGRGTWDALKHAGIGILPFLNSAGRNTDPNMGGGRSGGASITPLPNAQPEEDTPLPPGPVIPPTPVTGGYLTGQQPKAKVSALQMPKLPKKLGRR